MRMGAIVLDAFNPDELADFYSKLLGWTKEVQNTDEGNWIVVKSNKGEGLPLVFQYEPDYEPPQWPTEKGRQQQMQHLDFYLELCELDNQVKYALECGATLVEVQPSENWKVLLDPAGHPFCLIPIPE